MHSEDPPSSSSPLCPLPSHMPVCVSGNATKCARGKHIMPLVLSILLVCRCFMLLMHTFKERSFILFDGFACVCECVRNCLSKRIWYHSFAQHEYCALPILYLESLLFGTLIRIFRQIFGSNPTKFLCVQNSAKRDGYDFIVFGAPKTLQYSHNKNCVRKNNMRPVLSYYMRAAHKNSQAWTFRVCHMKREPNE